MSYLAGTNLLQTLTMPNGMSLTQEFETQRDLLTAMLYKRGTTGVVERHYTYDSLGRPLTRQQNRQGGSRRDSFTHNDRGETRRLYCYINNRPFDANDCTRWLATPTLWSGVDSPLPHEDSPPFGGNRRRGCPNCLTAC